jgi:hypothetical protein
MVGRQFIMRALQVLSCQGPEVLGEGAAGADGDNQGCSGDNRKETGHQVRLQASKRDRDRIGSGGQV